MIDFSLLPRRNKTYAGANGSKIAVMYEDELYMLKFPGVARKNKDMSYANGCICEYLGCHIFEIAGIPVQKTLLGTFTRNGKEKIVVACKDFTTPDTVIQDFASLKNTIIDSEHNGYGNTDESSPAPCFGKCVVTVAPERPNLRAIIGAVDSRCYIAATLIASTLCFPKLHAISLLPATLISQIIFMLVSHCFLFLLQ